MHFRKPIAILSICFIADTNPLDTSCLTYESVLLKALNRNVPNPTQQTVSYNHIDAMLDRMLSEVERTEKLFSLDLDVLDQEGSCVNTIELTPTTHALIEIPIKKTYESTHQIKIIEDASSEQDDFGTVMFHNANNVESDTSHDYDLIDFGETTSNDLKNIQDSIDKLIMEVENDEAQMLLDDITGKDYLESITFINSNYQRASSEESVKDSSESSADSWENNAQDYEPIDSSNHSKYVSTQPCSDIWYEGIYRNLSIVPEEDEENISLIGSLSHKSHYKNYEPVDVDFPIYSVPRHHTPSDESESDSSDVVNENLPHSITEKVIKAEIKLLVKTTEHGKEAIEIRSVREFMESPNRRFDDQFMKRSKTLPARQSKREQFSKKYSDSCLDIRASDRKERVPVFTLPRVFIRAPEMLNNTKNRNEIYATPTKKFPLHYNYQQTIDTKATKKPIDLYANTPFKPCYSRVQSVPVPQAYCDWVPQNYDTGGDSEPKLEKTETQQTVITTTTTTTTSRAETEEPTMRGTQQQSQQERPIQDQHMLSDEMKRLLQELEEESKK